MRIAKINISSVTESANNFKVIQGNGVLGEEYTDRAYIGNAGFSHIPRADDIAIVNVLGNTVIATATETMDRPILSNVGDSVVYSNENVFIKVLESGVIEIDNGNGKIELKANGDVDINGGNLTVEA